MVALSYFRIIQLSEAEALTELERKINRYSLVFILTITARLEMGSMQEHRKSSESAAESLPFLEKDIRPSTKAFKPEDAEPPAGVARCLWDTPFLRYAVFHGIAFCSYAALISLVISTHWARSPMCDSIIYCE